MFHMLEKEHAEEVDKKPMSSTESAAMRCWHIRRCCTRRGRKQWSS